MPGEVGRRMPRIQSVVLPLLRNGLPVSVDVGSWTKEVSSRTYPLVNIRRVGGLSNPKRPDELDRAVIELSGYTSNRDDLYEGLPGAEDLVIDAMYVVWDAVDKQTVIADVGYLHSWFVTMGPTQFDSPYDDTFRVQTLIQLGLKPLPIENS